MDILVIKTPYGLKIKISNIEFEYDKAELRGNAFKILDRVTEILEKYSTYKVRIEGHTDNIGTAEYNKTLSTNRAKAVYQYLVTNKISAKRLEYKGYGFDKPIDTNETEEGRAQNRRVELKKLQ